MKRLLARRWWVALACAACVAVPPAAAGTEAVLTYASGTYGVGGKYHTQYYGVRTFNRVYHEAGYMWEVHYEGPDGGQCCSVQGTANPTVYTGTWSNVRAFCVNIGDSSGTTWTCQTSSS